MTWTFLNGFRNIKTEKTISKDESFLKRSFTFFKFYLAHQDKES